MLALCCPQSQCYRSVRCNHAFASCAFALQASHDIKKQRLGANGSPVAEVEQHDVKQTQKKDSNATACGSCYGAESELYKCCNTCDEVRVGAMSSTYPTKAVAPCCQQQLHTGGGSSSFWQAASGRDVMLILHALDAHS